MVDVWDFADSEPVEDRLEGGAVEMLSPTVEDEVDQGRTPAYILAISLRSFAFIPEMVCCCFFVFVWSYTG